MSTRTDCQPSLDDLLAAYERAFTRALAAPPSPDLRAVDATFARLRAAVHRQWPVAGPRADALGLAANDLLDAVKLEQDTASAHTAHALALFQLRVALCGAARDGAPAGADMTAAG